MRNKWISAVKRKDWEPNEYTWLCSAHFISGVKSYLLTTCQAFSALVQVLKSLDYWIIMRREIEEGQTELHANRREE